MKTIFRILTTFLFCVILSTMISCEKTIVSNSDEPYLYDAINYGQIHNDILDMYYSLSESTRQSFTFSDKVDFVDSCIYVLMDSADLGDFSSIVNNCDTLKDYLADISDTTFESTDVYDMLDEMLSDGQITTNEHAYFEDIFDVYELHPFEYSKILSDVLDIEDDVEVDENLSDNERDNIMAVIDISKSSLDYWSSKKSYVPWYAKDVVGAYTATMTGVVAYATLLCPGWGTAIALIGSAAFASCI